MEKVASLRLKMVSILTLWTAVVLCVIILSIAQIPLHNTI